MPFELCMRKLVASSLLTYLKKIGDVASPSGFILADGVDVAACTCTRCREHELLPEALSEQSIKIGSSLPPAAHHHSPAFLIGSAVAVLQGKVPRHEVTLRRSGAGCPRGNSKTKGSRARGPLSLLNEPANRKRTRNNLSVIMPGQMAAP